MRSVRDACIFVAVMWTVRIVENLNLEHILEREEHMFWNTSFLIRCGKYLELRGMVEWYL